MIAELMPYPAMKDSGIEWLAEVPEHWRGAAGKLTEYRHPINNYRLFKLAEVENLLRDILAPDKALMRRKRTAK